MKDYMKWVKLYNHNYHLKKINKIAYLEHNKSDSYIFAPWLNKKLENDKTILTLFFVQ